MTHPFRSLLIALLISVFVCLAPVASTRAAEIAPAQMLSVTDLPNGFAEIAAAKVEGCQRQGEHGELAAFELKTGETTLESICLSSFGLTELAENQFQASLMRQMFDALLDNPQAMIAQAGTAQAAGVELLTPAHPVGEKAMSFRQIQAGQRHEIMVFRRGDRVGSVAVHYQDGAQPAVPLEEIATQLDRRISKIPLPQ